MKKATLTSLSKEDPMRKGVHNLKAMLGVVLGTFLIFCFGYPSAAKDAQGSVIGFIYGQDGTTPLPGAVVKLKNLITGSVYESTPADDYGIFKVQDIQTGLYTYGVATQNGDYNAENLVGFTVEENDVAKLTIVVDPYEKGVAEALDEVKKGLETSGEFLVGTIASFDPATRMAQVQVVNGLLRLGDKIRARGKSTNFYQEITLLKIGNALARQLIKGQVGALQLEQSAAKGDLVYVVKESRRIMPFFLAPVGVAMVVAGNTAVTYGIVKIEDKCRPTSPKK